MSEFYPNKASRYGLSTYCKPCTRVYKKKYRQENPDKIAHYMAQDRDRHPERYREQDHRRYEGEGRGFRYAAERQARIQAQFVAEVRREEIYKRDNGICGICGEHVEYSEFELDHIVPLVRGGEHGPSNVQVSHGICNRKKYVRLLPELKNLAVMKEGSSYCV